MKIDENKLNALMGRMVGELGAIASAPLAILGDRLGLYKAMAGAGPMSADALSAATGIRLRYAQEWLNAQAASGNVDYDAATQTYSLSPEAAQVFAEEDSPAFLCGGFEALMSFYMDIDKVQKAFTSGTGLGWHEHHPSLFSGTERFFRAGYNANLEPSWIPALDGLADRLRSGALVADVGCGFGASSMVMATPYPMRGVGGAPPPPPWGGGARARARKAGVDDRVRFEVAGAKDFPGRGFDMVAFFDCLHDMGDPIGAGRHVRETLADGGTWMIVEPFAGDRVEDNLNPVGRIFYSASTLVCTPCSLSQDGAMGLGAQAGEKRLREVASAAGFGHFRRATQTPFNMVFEARV